MKEGGGGGGVGVTMSWTANQQGHGHRCLGFYLRTFFKTQASVAWDSLWTWGSPIPRPICIPCK